MSGTDRLNTALAGRYKIEKQLGQGGMATVYLAKDIKHDRMVAVKVLKPELAAVLGAERFVVEIKTTAALQHPHILPLFDSGTADSFLYYVMPYIEGETLRDKLNRETQFGIDEAVKITTQVADALDYAHRHGVIHRDIKPENILLHDGRPMVADFGIALAVSAAAGGRMTETGLSLGTPHYMSPEQATAEKEITGRSDIYSLASVLYEMLAGEPPHGGGSAQQIIMKIITEPAQPVTTRRKSVPPNVAAAVGKALEKLPADRFATAHEFAEALQNRSFTSAAFAGSVGSGHGSRVTGHAAVIAASSVAILATIVAIWLALRTQPAADAATIRFQFVTADSERFVSTTPAIPFSISADSRSVVYVGSGSQFTRRLYVRGLDDMQTRALPGTDGLPTQPTFSPDGKWVAFVLNGSTVKTPTTGGPVNTIVALDGKSNAGMSWVDPDTIIMSIGGAIFAAPVNGGSPVRIVVPDTAAGEIVYFGPRVINRRYVALINVGAGGLTTNKLGILDRKTGKVIRTDRPCTTALGAIDDRVICVAPNGTVTAALLNGDGGLGPSQIVLEDVLVRPGGAAKAALSSTGSLIYHRGSAVSRLIIADDHGVAQPPSVEPRAFAHPRWSPDGASIAVSVSRNGSVDIWIVDVRTGAMRKLTPSDGLADEPEWSPDSKRVVFRYLQPSGSTIRWMPADGSAPPQRFAVGTHDPFSPTFSPDGKLLVMSALSGDQANGADVAYAPLDNLKTLSFVALTPGHEYTPSVSPDGHWVVYANASTGRAEVYVRPFPGPGVPTQISKDGGAEPVWSRDGRTIYFRRTRVVAAAKVTLGATVTVSSITDLFTGDLIVDPGYGDFDVAPGGKRFAVLQNVDRQEETVFIYNWAAELRKSWQK